MTDHNPTTAVSRRPVRNATGGLFAGATLLAGQDRTVADERLESAIAELTADVNIADVAVPDAGAPSAAVRRHWVWGTAPAGTEILAVSTDTVSIQPRDL